MTSPDLPPILFEDEAVVAFDKPSGMLAVPDRWDTGQESLLTLARARYGETAANAHRLDRDTSGVLLFAKTRAATVDLTRQFERHAVEKLYLAITSPPPPKAADEITIPLIDDPSRPGRMVVRRDGKEAATRYRVLETWRGTWALVELRPLTGRTHQLRVHLQAHGAPIVGDAWYGGVPGIWLSQIKRDYRARKGINPAQPTARSGRRGEDQAETTKAETPILARLALHAASLTFVHPTSGAAMTIESPLPDDWERALKQLRRHASP